MAKIYTKTGDKGQCSLKGGQRVLKSDYRICAIGEIDELNAVLGIVSQTKKVVKLQQDLFLIGALLSGSPVKKNNLPARIITIEKKIDTMQSKMPELKNFILPGGSKAAAQLHLARSVCRRAERTIVKLDQASKDKSTKEIISYLNRLSDFLFVLARWVNFKAGIKDNIWKN